MGFLWVSTGFSSISMVLGPVGPSFTGFSWFWGPTDHSFTGFSWFGGLQGGEAPEPYFWPNPGLGPLLAGRLLFGGLRTQVYGQAPRLADTESLGTPPPGKDESLAEDSSHCA